MAVWHTAPLQIQNIRPASLLAVVLARLDTFSVVVFIFHSFSLVSALFKLSTVSLPLSHLPHPNIFQFVVTLTP